MNKVSFKEGTKHYLETNISKMAPGTLYFTTDTNDLYKIIQLDSGEISYIPYTSEINTMKLNMVDESDPENPKVLSVITLTEEERNKILNCSRILVRYLMLYKNQTDDLVPVINELVLTLGYKTPTTIEQPLIYFMSTRTNEHTWIGMFNLSNNKFSIGTNDTIKNTVKLTNQSLTEAQKEIARNNIDAQKTLSWTEI